MKFRNNRYDVSGKIIGQKYNNWKDIYLNLYNATGKKEVVKNINNKLK